MGQRSTQGSPQPTGSSAGRPGPPPVRLPRPEVERIFASGGYVAVNELGLRLGDSLAERGVTKSQVRNILNSFQAITETWEATDAEESGRQIARLKPNLKYLAARETNPARKMSLDELADTLGHGIDLVLEAAETTARRGRYTTLVDLVEAITAYHRVKARNE